MPRSRPLTILAGGIQLVSVTGDPAANVAKITRLGRELKSAHPQPALLVAPELAVTGYSAGERFHTLAEPWPHGDSLGALAALARELEVVLVAGYAEASSTPGLIYDSAAVFERNGQPIASCRKSHCLDSERRSRRSPAGLSADRRGRRSPHYSIVDIFKPNSIYGVWSPRGLLAYGIGFAAEIPFMVLLNLVTLKSYYTGPFAKDLNSVDISWIVGAVATAVAYFLLTRNFDPACEQAAIEESDRELHRSEVVA